MNRLAAIAAGMVALLAAPALALTPIQPVTPPVPLTTTSSVTFDDISTGNVGTKYVAKGVTFAGFVVHDESFGGAVQYDSGTHYAHVLGTSRIDFVNPLDPMLGATANYVSFDNLGLTAGGGWYNGFTVSVYGAPANPFSGGTLLTSVTVAPANAAAGRAQFTTTINQVGMSYLIFSPIQNVAGSGLAPIDNFTFGAVPAAPVPEPGEWAMMAAGLGIVGAASRRRRRNA